MSQSHLLAKDEIQTLSDKRLNLNAERPQFLQNASPDAGVAHPLEAPPSVDDKPQHLLYNDEKIHLVVVLTWNSGYLKTVFGMLRIVQCVSWRLALAAK